MMAASSGMRSCSTPWRSSHAAGRPAGASGAGAARDSFVPASCSATHCTASRAARSTRLGPVGSVAACSTDAVIVVWGSSPSSGRNVACSRWPSTANRWRRSATGLAAYASWNSETRIALTPSNADRPSVASLAGSDAGDGRCHEAVICWLASWQQRCSMAWPIVISSCQPAGIAPTGMVDRDFMIDRTTGRTSHSPCRLT